MNEGAAPGVENPGVYACMDERKGEGVRVPAMGADMGRV